MRYLHPFWFDGWFKGYATRILPPTNPLPILIEDPFIEEIRLRVRWGWQDAMAKRAESIR